MGYAFYERDGMERGYGVEDTCHADGCHRTIDRGLAYLCYGCTQYFCGDHLGYWADEPLECFAGLSTQVCAGCAQLTAERGEEPIV